MPTQRFPPLPGRRRHRHHCLRPHRLEQHVRMQRAAWRRDSEEHAACSREAGLRRTWGPGPIVCAALARSSGIRAGTVPAGTCREAALCRPLLDRCGVRPQRACGLRPGGGTRKSLRRAAERRNSGDHAECGREAGLGRACSVRRAARRRNSGEHAACAGCRDSAREGGLGRTMRRAPGRWDSEEHAACAGGRAAGLGRACGVRPRSGTRESMLRAAERRDSEEHVACGRKEGLGRACSVRRRLEGGSWESMLRAAGSRDSIEHALCADVRPG